MNIGERSQIKEQDLNRQLCRRLNLGEDLDLGCRDRYREYRKPKRYKQPFRKTIENWEQSLNSDGVIVAFQNQQEIYEYCKSTLRGTVLQFFRNMEQENSSYFQEVRNNFSISVFINLIKLYFLGTTQEDVNEPVLYLYKFEQLKLCNLSYIK